MSLPPATNPQPDPDFIRRLAASIEGEVRPGLHDRLLYATDASLYQVEPLAVVIPASMLDAARAVRVCAASGVAILPRGGGTSLAGQCTNRAVVLDMTPNCRRVLELDEAGRRCRVEPGLTIDDLNDAIRGSGLFFAPDPATSRQAAIGGCVGDNAAGARSIRYGRTSENLLGLKVCLADGSVVTLDEGAALRDERVAALTRRVVEVVRKNEALIRERFPKTLRRNAGYALDAILAQLDADPGDLSKVNLAHLLCGSEGTLAVTLEAELLLHPIPAARGLAVAAFESVDAAMDALLPVLELEPSAVELLDDMVLGLAREQNEYRRYVDLLPSPGDTPPAAVLYVEFTADDDPAEIDERFAALRSIVSPERLACHTDAAAMLDAWKLRKAGEPLLHGLPGARKPMTFVEDNAVPPEHLAEFVRRFRAIVEKHGTTAAFFAHASVGVLHVRPLLDIHSQADRQTMQAIAVEVADLARELGGVMSGEHGDGRVRGPLLERYFGGELMAAFREIKTIFDPANLLNPGNITEPGPVASMAAHLRVKPEDAEVRVPPVETFYNYSDSHGFESAALMCNGAGVCRKKTGGTMCPSYMATLDERHSTRGRANALRLAITGQTGGAAPAFNDPETLTTLDLCLSCKACKSECPSNVDVARLKTEYLAGSDRAQGGPPLARRVMGNIDTLNRIACVAPSLTNAVNRVPLVRAALSRVLGIDRRRSLPVFAKPLHKHWVPGPADADESRPAVVIVADTFTVHNEPHIALAARAVLEDFGYRVILHRANDLGRAAISQGLLPQAIATAEREIDRFSELPVAPTPLLTLEPSVHSVIIDDWLSLNINRPIETRRAIAARTVPVEDFLEKGWETHPDHPPLRPLERGVLLHGHCHQKALWSAGPTASLLERIAPGRVIRPDTGCCGMAGSFGFTHYDLSMKIADLTLVPALIELHRTPIVAPGTSCRHQIADATGEVAHHPITLIAAALAVED
jgi:FAD/FMN-containing dehydrogenase/Fe-S oxidoreductase